MNGVSYSVRAELQGEHFSEDYNRKLLKFLIL